MQQIKEHAIDVLVVDPFVSCHEVFENDNPAIDMVAKEWSRVAELGSCAIHLVHHTRKAAGFIAMEVLEFAHLIAEGAGPSRSAFLSAYFTLVGTHGLHVTAGLLWLAVMMHQTFSFGLDEVVRRRVACLSLFWHFLDLIWICVFTFVYLRGVL